MLDLYPSIPLSCTLVHKYQMMEATTINAPDLDVLFDLFNEDFCEDPFDHSLSGEIESDNADDNTDETSSESSGSSGRSSNSSHISSSPFQHISTYYPSFSTCNTSENSGDNSSSNKRTKVEDKLKRNRESANKSRLKRKNEKFELEDTVAALRERVRTLEMENNALLTDNTTLSQHNFFLQSMLKNQKESSGAVQEKTPSSQSHMSALSGISMLCVVFSISFFNEWLPSSMQSSAGSGEDPWNPAESSTGRVLLSVAQDDILGSARHFSLSDTSYAFVQPPRGADAWHLHYVLILTSVMCFYYFYVQQRRCHADKKSNCILPS